MIHVPFVVVSDTSNNNRIIKNKRGISWTVQSSVSNDHTNHKWGNITFGKGLFIVISQDSILFSRNAKHWISILNIPHHGLDKYYIWRSIIHDFFWKWLY